MTLDKTVALAEELQRQIQNNKEAQQGELGGEMLPRYLAAREYQLNAIQRICNYLKCIKNN